ncbi:MAG: LytTR family DNA-binding domain-containing protein [Reyranella sp.]|nr:LytTR family DNA-binding domain-containing protein [Reyranella sp.]
MPRVLIVDDEHLARQAMRRLLANHPEVEIVGEAHGVSDALREIERTQPQLVFLDIELGGADGFDLLASLEAPPVVVFVTAYAEYAVEAFAVNAVDYLLKPVDPERLAESLKRAGRELARAEAQVGAPSGGGSSGGGVIAFKTPKRTVLAKPAEIVALRADGDFTHVFVADQTALMIWRTLSHFESLLPSPPFLRLGRSLIVNRDRLRTIETPSRETARLMLHGMDEPLTLGRAAAARLREALGDDFQPDES